MDNLLTRLSDLEEWADANEYEDADDLGDTLREAMEDLYEACKGSPCNNGICVKKNCTGNHIPCDFEWRGQQAGKGL